MCEAIVLKGLGLRKILPLFMKVNEKFYFQIPYLLLIRSFCLV